MEEPSRAEVSSPIKKQQILFCQSVSRTRHFTTLKMLTAEQKALMTLTTEWAFTFYLVEKKRNPFRQLYEETSVSHEIQLTCYNVNHLLKRKLNIQY